MNELTLKDQAIKYQSLGLKIFPLIPGTKNPIEKGGFHNASNDLDEIMKWWDSTPNANIGLPASDNNLVIVDLDVKKGNDGITTLENLNLDIPPTLTSNTPNNGIHLFYKTDKKFTNKVDVYPGIDIRGNGYVVLPPSIIPGQGEYKWVDFDINKIAEINEDVEKLVTGKALGEKEDNERFVLPEVITEGERNDVLFRYTSSLQAKGYSDKEIAEIIYTTAEERCSPPLDEKEWRELKTSVKEALKRYPKGFERDRKGKKILKTTNNIKKALEVYNIEVKFNILKNRIEVTNTKKDVDGVVNQLQDFFQVEFNLNLSHDFIGKKIIEIAKDNKFNPFKDFLLESKKSNPNPGSELEKVINTLTFPEHKEEHVKFYKTMIKKFLISIVAINMTDVEAEESPRLEGTLVLTGGQGIGKTTWFSKLVPKGFFAEGKSITGDKDNRMEITQYILVELGELEEITTKKEAGFLKNELTRTFDEYRVPYDKFPIRKARRYLYCGTVNESKFLTDSTGNRRYWVVEVEDINLDEEINLNYLWSDVIDLYNLGSTWWLSKEEHQLLDMVNGDYLVNGYIGLLIESVFDFSKEPVKHLDYTGADIFELLKYPKGLNPNKLGRELSKLGLKSKVKRVNGKSLRFYNLPPIKKEHVIFDNRDLVNYSSKIYLDNQNGKIKITEDEKIINLNS